MIKGYPFNPSSESMNGLVLANERTVAIISKGIALLPNMDAEVYSVITGTGYAKPLTGVYIRHNASSGSTSISTSPGTEGMIPFWMVKFDLSEVDFASKPFSQTTGIMSATGYMYDLVADGYWKNASDGMIGFTNLRLQKRGLFSEDSPYEPGNPMAEIANAFSTMLYASNESLVSGFALAKGDIDQLTAEVTAEQVVASPAFDNKLEEATGKAAQAAFQELDQIYVTI